MGVATIFYWNEQPPNLTGSETIERLELFERMAGSAIKSFSETRDRAWTWPKEDKWMRFLMDCNSRIAYLKGPEPRGEYLGYVS